MTKYTLKQLSPKGWILTSNGERIGIVSQTDDGITIVGKIYPKRYKDISDLKKSLGGKVTIEKPAEPTTEAEESIINGYPIKHSVHYNILLEPIPSYTRTLTSEIRYAAGYYSIKFSNGWTPSFCPKLVTLLENEYIGPYTTKLEMQHQISTKNKEINV